jgi:hypothetical protein
MLLYKICLFFILFLCRLLYDINYLYKNCIIKYDWFNVLIISITHSLMYAIIISGWMFDIYITNIILIFCLGIVISWKIFSDCLIVIEINKLCNNDVLHKHYDPKHCVITILQLIIVLLYIYKYLNYFLCY